MPVNGFGEVAERLRRSTVQVTQGRAGQGSGVLAGDGLVVTNAHVARASNATVELWDGRKLPARLKAKDSRRDLALLELDGNGLPAAELGRREEPRIGELVIAIGNPLGFQGALTTGVVHAYGPLAGLGPANWVQASVRLAPGNSGGPLADADGRVIGINTMIAGGLGLAVPVGAVRTFLRVGPDRASLGVTVRPVRVPRKPELGLLVLDVDEGSPAAASSLMVGDVLVAADGAPFKAADDLLDAIDRAPGLLHLRFLRGERSADREVAVRLSRRSSEAA